MNNIIIQYCERCIQKRQERLKYINHFICEICIDKPPQNYIDKIYCIHPYLCFDCNNKYLKLYGDNYTIYGSVS